MAAVIMAGSRSGAGKTAVGCALIAALPEFTWVACKLSPHHHKSEPIWAETDSTSQKDTARYLDAGAQQAYLIAVPPISLITALPGNLDRQQPGSSLLVESNQLRPIVLERTGRNVVCLAVLADAPSSWKKSFWSRIFDADALVLTNGMTSRQLPDELQDKIVFTLDKSTWSSPELVQFVRNRLLLAPG